MGKIKPNEKLEEYESSLYVILNRTDPERVIFLEGLICLEELINHILMYYFCGNIETGAKLEKYLLDNLSYRTKTNILKETKIISKELFKDLDKIGEHRNLAAHASVITYDTNGNVGWVWKKRIVRRDSKFIDEYKKRVAKCYAHLHYKLDVLISDTEKSAKNG